MSRVELGAKAPAVALLAGWLALLAVAALVVAHATITADLTAFLPVSANSTQQLLMDQLRDGVASRTILVAIEGGDEQHRADASRSLAGALAHDPRFRFVANGSFELSEPDQRALLPYRYLLSPQTTPEQFGEEALHRALEVDLALLASSSGPMVARNLPADPTGAILSVLKMLSPARAPDMRQGVWFSADGRRALALLETRAAGFDPDGQASAIAAVRGAFAAAPDSAGLSLVLAGPGVFAAVARQAIEGDAWRLSTIATVCVLALLMWVYRSPALVAAGALPVLTGLISGIAAVATVFGMVHGITLGFGATLIGEAVDYPTYLLVQRESGEAVAKAARRIWPTLRLAVLTTVFSSLTMLLSSFRGLAQLGVLSLTGILVAGAVTRWIIPLLPLDHAGRSKRQAMPRWLDPSALAGAGAAVRGVAALAVLAGAGYIVAQRSSLWDDDLENLSPISQRAKDLDGELRGELHAPDVRYLLVARGDSQESVLQANEAIAEPLQHLVANGVLGGFDLVSNYLPSEKRQAERRAALPDTATLTRSVALAQEGLPFRPGTFAPFIHDVAATRAGLALHGDDLQTTALGLKLRSMIVRRGADWFTMIPLYEVTNPDAVGRLAAPGDAASLQFLDLKEESNRLIAGYRGQSLRLTALGFAAIAAVVLLGLRSLRATMAVLAPVVGATVLAVAVLLASGLKLTLFHLVALLLVIGVGVNYALFFNRPEPVLARRRLTALSLCICCSTTLSAFGALATSTMPVLHALGTTVGLGIVLSFALAAIFGSGAHPEAGSRVASAPVPDILQKRELSS